MSKKKTAKSQKRKRKNSTVKAGKTSKGPEKIVIVPRDHNKFQLTCNMCKFDKFYVKNSMIRSGRWASFFSTEWLFDKSAKVAICGRCSYVHWFKDRKAVQKFN